MERKEPLKLPLDEKEIKRAISFLRLGTEDKEGTTGPLPLNEVIEAINELRSPPYRLDPETDKDMVREAITRFDLQNEIEQE